MDAIGPDGSTTELYRQMAAQFGGAGAPFEPMVHRSTLIAFSELQYLRKRVFVRCLQ